MLLWPLGGGSLYFTYTELRRTLTEGSGTYATHDDRTRETAELVARIAGPAADRTGGRSGHADGR
ncbi:hypothetical protein [Streptomyces sp. CNZ287]|uniref:hypothetical protein n=1 Tax=Streptomyces sp. B22F1 TaxID=3153566 RepID=UPI001199B8AD